MSRAVMMVPTNDYNNLVNYYKGAITENALLNKAGRLAAEKHLVLKNKKLPDDVAVAIARGKGRALNKLTRRIRTGSVKASGARVEDDDDGDRAMLYAPMENTLKQILKQTKPPRVPIPPPPPPLRYTSPPPLYRSPVRRVKTPARSTTKTPVSTTKKTSPSLTKSVKSGMWKSLKKSLGFKVDPPSPSGTESEWTSASEDDDEEVDSDDYQETPKGAKGGKKTPRALKRIKPSSGWVDFTKGKIKRKHPLQKKKKN